MAIREPIGSETRRCETNVIAIDGGCLTCAAARGQACGLYIPERRREIMNRRRRAAHLERLACEGASAWC
jgi:hypothetical protein